MKMLYVAMFYFKLSWIEGQMKIMWENASEEVRSAYGREYFDAIYTGTKAAAKEASKTMAPCIDAMEDAVINVSPKIRYLVDGSIRTIDYNCVSFFFCFFLFFFFGGGGGGMFSQGF